MTSEFFPVVGLKWPHIEKAGILKEQYLGVANASKLLT